MDKDYVALLDSGIIGPYTAAEMVTLDRVGDINKYTSVRPPGGGAWLPWWQVREDLEKLGALPDGEARRTGPLRYVKKTSPTGEAEADGREVPLLSRGVYILLALFLGTLGIHNFYAGRGIVGIVQIGATLCGIMLLVLVGFPGLVVGAALVFWILVEIVTQTRDGHGRLMS